MLPVYELVLLYRHVPKDELATHLKRTANFIFNKTGFLRRLDYLGLQKCPWRQSKDRKPYWEAEYFYCEFNMPKVKVADFLSELSRDADVVKYTIYPVPKVYDIDFKNCTFEEENLPVPYRPAVIKLVQEAKEHQRRKLKFPFRQNTNLSYYPFQR